MPLILTSLGRILALKTSLLAIAFAKGPQMRLIVYLILRISLPPLITLLSIILVAIRDQVIQYDLDTRVFNSTYNNESVRFNV
jgi:hypothetical protein